MLSAFAERLAELRARTEHRLNPPNVFVCKEEKGIYILSDPTEPQRQKQIRPSQFYLTAERLGFADLSSPQKMNHDFVCLYPDEYGQWHRTKDNLLNKWRLNLPRSLRPATYILFTRK